MAAMGSVAAGIGAAVGTGAFSSTEVDRDVTVDVANDAAGYLALSATEDPNGAFASGSDTGEISISFAESDNGNTGVNRDSTTVFENVFQIENQGTQTVQLTLADAGGSNQAIVVQPPGSIGDEGSTDVGDNPVGDEGVAVALATAPGEPLSSGQMDSDPDGDGNLELETEEYVKDDFAVKTNSDGEFPPTNGLEINADDADNNTPSTPTETATSTSTSTPTETATSTPTATSTSTSTATSTSSGSGS